jgi:hypothetical protein
MLLKELQIRSLVAALLLEGVKADIIASNPDVNLSDIEYMAKTYQKGIAWLNARFGPSARIEEEHPINDAMMTLKNFAEKDKAIGQSYLAGKKFTAEVDNAFQGRTRVWKSPNDITTMSADDMEIILALVSNKDQNVKIESTLDIESDRVGKVGPWNLWMPTTMEKSCKIAGYDPITYKTATTWCTARTAGSNLFYHYVGRPKEDIVLFYLIKDSPSENKDWLSVGYRNGKPVLTGERGGLSVKRDNSGLRLETLKEILDSDFDAIMSILDAKASKMSGVHPAKQKVKDAGQDIELLMQMLKGHSKEENNSFITSIVGLDAISPEVMEYIANNGNNYQLASLAIKKTITPKTLDIILSRSKDPVVVSPACFNPNVRPETLDALARTGDASTKMIVASSPSTSLETLEMLAITGGDDLKIAIAKNSKASPEILLKIIQLLPKEFLGHAISNSKIPVNTLIDLSKSNNASIFTGLAKNKALPTAAIENILDSPGIKDIVGLADTQAFISNITQNPRITSGQIAKLFSALPEHQILLIANPAIPQEFLKNAIMSDDKQLSAAAHKNPNVSPDELAIFIKDPSYEVFQRVRALSNPSMPIDSLRAAIKDTSLGSRRFLEILDNPNTPPDVLNKLLRADEHTRSRIAYHPRVTQDILLKLSNDRAANVSWSARTVLKSRNDNANLNEVIERVILRLI